MKPTEEAMANRFISAVVGLGGLLALGASSAAAADDEWTFDILARDGGVPKQIKWTNIPSFISSLLRS